MDVMIGEDGVVRLSGEEDFRSFRVVVPEGWDAAKAGAILGEAGVGAAHEQEGHVWVEAGALRAWLVALAPASHWQGELSAMLDYARNKGWTDGSGYRIAAHVAAAEGLER